MSHRSPYAHRSCIATTCETCEGSGRVTVTRSRWIGGTRDGYRSEWTGAVRCETCEGYGETYRSKLAAAMPTPEPTPPARARRAHDHGAGLHRGELRSGDLPGPQ